MQEDIKSLMNWVSTSNNLATRFECARGKFEPEINEGDVVFVDINVRDFKDKQNCVYLLQSIKDDNEYVIRRVQKDIVTGKLKLTTPDSVEADNIDSIADIETMGFILLGQIVTSIEIKQTNF